ncbi:MAG TPA: hypothetical protein VIC06_14015 [Solirubrobacteraceae bacterium]|jgi:hypothetical protein
MRARIHRHTRSLAGFASRRAALLALVGCIALAALTPAGAMASFGISGFDGSITNQDGSPDTQAGSHPYAYTTRIAFNTLTNHFGEQAPDGNVKDVRVEVPAGLVGDPTAVPRCSNTQLLKPGGGGAVALVRWRLRSGS